MRFLKPVEDAQASPQIKATYQKIRKQLGITFVPPIFQLMANYEDYLLHLWSQIETNLETTEFSQLSKRISQHAEAVTNHWISIDPELAGLAPTLTPKEIKDLKKTVAGLTAINATLALVTIAIRENIKGIALGILKLDKQAAKNSYTTETSEEKTAYDLMSIREKSSNLSPTSQLLAPLTGNQSLAISRYSQFFTAVAKFMDKLLKTETYLTRRVALEELILNLVPQIPRPFSITYKEFMELTQKSPQAKHIAELTFLLHDLFPAKFPHLVFTCAIMTHALSPSSSILSKKA
ncbi:MAG: hypothetical protein HYS86_03980 [Candidatus Chisholmbacteria bacterium]|nr:hypothetical protein [Candidatus Chisholmbacteria bacterium]